MDEAKRRALKILDELVCERASGPYVVDSEYASLIARAEALPENQDGADKTWVERMVQHERELWRRIQREKPA